MHFSIHLRIILFMSSLQMYAQATQELHEDSIPAIYAQALLYRDGKMNNCVGEESANKAEALFLSVAESDDSELKHKAEHNYTLIQLFQWRGKRTFTMGGKMY